MVKNNIAEQNPPIAHNDNLFFKEILQSSIGWIKWAAAGLVVIVGGILWYIFLRIDSLEKRHQDDHDKLIKLEVYVDFLKKP